MWLALFWYPPYCSDLELNLRYLWGMPVLQAIPEALEVLEFHIYYYQLNETGYSSKYRMSFSHHYYLLLYSFPWPCYVFLTGKISHAVCKYGILPLTRTYKNKLISLPGVGKLSRKVHLFWICVYMVCLRDFASTIVAWQ